MMEAITIKESFIAQAAKAYRVDKEKIIKQAIIDYLGVDDIEPEELRGRLSFLSHNSDYDDGEGFLSVDNVQLIHFGPLQIINLDMKVQMNQPYRLLKPERNKMNPSWLERHPHGLIDAIPQDHDIPLDVSRESKCIRCEKSISQGILCWRCIFKGDVESSDYFCRLDESRKRNGEG